MAHNTPSFDLDPNRRELRIEGKFISLPPKAFSLLEYLVTNRQRMVSKRELMEAFWPSNNTDAALLKTVSLIRKELSGNGSSNALIKTYHGLGYRFIDNTGTESNSQTNNLDEANVVLEENQWISVICVHLSSESSGPNYAPDDSSDFNQYLNQAQSIVEQHQGRLLHMLVDGFSASFGQEILYEDVARRAVVCAEALWRASLAIKAFTVTIGIDIGAVPKTQQQTESQSSSWNPPSNVERLATQLARSARRDTILLSKRVVEHLQDEIEVETADENFLLLSAPPQRAGIPGRPLKHPSNFVGRGAELVFLEEKSNGVSSGRGQAVVLSGPAGIGKTRLISEFLIGQNPSDCHYILVHCLPNLANTALTPIRELCSITLTYIDTDALALNDVEQALLRELLGTPNDAEPTLESLSDHEHRQKSYRVLLRIIFEACRDKKFIVVLEDAHWMDATSREYLHEISQKITTLKFLLVITTRPTDTLPMLDSVMHLSPLTHDASLEILRNHQEAQEMAASTANILVQRAAGNPFFLEELAFAARGGADPNAPPPETVQAVISARIASLPPNLRTLLYVISVIGSPASLEIVLHLYSKNHEQTKSEITHLMKSGFVIEEMTFVSFRHMLINDAAYAMISLPDRCSLHKKIAQYLEQRIELEVIQPEVIAKHYQEAGEIEHAIQYWMQATRDAQRSSALHETVAFAKQGLAILNTQLMEHKVHGIYLELMRASALIKLKGFGNIEAGQAYTRAQELNKTVNSVKSRVRILVGLWIHDWVRGNLNVSLAHGRELMTLAKGSDSPPLILQSHASMGQVLMHIGQTREAFKHLEIAIDIANEHPPRTIPEQNAAVSCAAYAAWTASLLGRSVDATKYFEKSLQLAQRVKNPFAQAIHCALCAAYFMHEQDVSGCLSISNEAVAISREHHFDFWLGTGLVLRGWALGQQGLLEEAFLALDEGIAVFESTDAGVQLANWYGLKAEIQLQAGQLHASLDSAQKALQHAELTGDVYFSPRIHAVAQSIYKKLGDTERAAFHQSKSQTLAKDYDFSDRVINLSP